MRLALIAAIGIALPVLAGCARDAEPPRASSTAPVIAPGRPGEPARTLDPAATAPAVPSPTAAAADVRFMQDMIVHHRQALEMSTAAATRAASDGVRRIAARIAAAQGPEIKAMERWLRDQGQRVPDHHAAHDRMPGMATEAQLTALRAARGAAFDRMFLDLMIAHHLGAITMSATEIEDGTHTMVQELAQDISVGQTAEVNRMRRLQAG
ncbi:lipoprotein [Sphaerisporangium rufum]|uniref:Lipoprotein n=1 Tax=Sphaerisporangium rufum TaxID=1381558 RepID=A0A919V0V1_9ACTN|nr:DUF305 domain-containing protein [Sphaerisporangium rufum]GII77143.1 lipoprotein [Sphaerisporangium rufum]